MKTVVNPAVRIRRHDSLNFRERAASLVNARVVWLYGKNDQLVASKATIVAPGDRTAFHISNPDEWPAGVHTAAPTIDDGRAPEYKFCVQNDRVQCLKVHGRVYSYIRDGARHYTSSKPSNAADVRIIPYEY